MANLLELFDDFAKPVYVKYTLEQGDEAKNIILIIDDFTKNAVFQYNLFDIDGNLYEVLSQNKNELYTSVIDFLKAFRSENFSYDAELFFTNQNLFIDNFIKSHIRDTFYIPEIPFYSVNNEVN